MATTTLSFNQIAAASSVDMVNSFAQDFSKLREMLAHSQFSVLPKRSPISRKLSWPKTRREKTSL